MFGFSKKKEEKKETKMTYMEKLGLEPVRRLNKKICVERVKYLRAGIEKKKWKGQLLERAKYYANWYGWVATTHNGHRPSRKEAVAAAAKKRKAA